MTTSAPQSGGGTPEPDHVWTLWPVVSPASRSPGRGAGAGSRTSGGAGRGWLMSSARFDPVTSSWRTSPGLFEIPRRSAGCSVTFTLSGSMRTGRLFPRVPWVHHTHVAGCSWWPTPTAAMGRRGWGLGRPEQRRYRVSTIERVHGVIASLGHWRPPVVMIERLMGLPDGWLRPAETPSSPLSPNTSDG
jgi:hypothetical protein